MLDDDSKRTLIIRAALHLAEMAGWWRLSLVEIAREANVSIADIHSEFRGKTGILRAFSSEVDAAVLSRARPDPEAPARDRLFDVLMARFEVMAPYKKALGRIFREFRLAPRSAAPFAGSVLRSQYWMLSAAGILADPPYGGVRVRGLAAVYARVMPIWLKDDDPGHARTMAALDRELRRGERRLFCLKSICGAFWCRDEGWRARPRDERKPPPEPEPKAQAPGETEPETGPGATAPRPPVREGPTATGRETERGPASDEPSEKDDQ